MAVTFHMTFQPRDTAGSFTIEVKEASFDAEQTLNIGSQSTGAGAGRVTFNPFSFKKTPDAHSADLWLKLCNGTPYQKVTFDVAKAGIGGGSSNTVPFVTFTMGLVAVKTISVATGDEAPTETVTLEYGQAAYAVTPQNPDGSLGKPVASGWDRVKNMAMDPAKVGAS